jgi:hypothetical protein
MGDTSSPLFTINERGATVPTAGVLSGPTDIARKALQCALGAAGVMLYGTVQAG